MDTLVDPFLKFNKLMGLHITNRLSADLKMGFGIQEFSGVVQDYQSCLSVIPSFSFIGQYHYLNRGILCSIDPKIIASSANRCFGGDGKQAGTDRQVFTASEQFMGNEFTGLCESFFHSKDCPIEYSRMEYFINRTHLFFSDEQVLFVTMKCTIQSNDVGSMMFVYPLQFVKQEQEKWAVSE